MIDSLTLCLSLAIFHEARGENKVGQYAVAEVIHNRTKHSDYPNDYCSVIKQKSQFSFVKNLKSLGSAPKYDLEAWRKSVQIAKDFRQNKTNFVGKALYFNTTRLGVRYKTNVKPVKIGNHVFY